MDEGAGEGGETCFITVHDIYPHFHPQQLTHTQKNIFTSLVKIKILFINFGQSTTLSNGCKLRKDHEKLKEIFKLQNSIS